MAEDDVYARLACDYDWLVTDELRDGTLLRSHFGAVIDGLPPGSPVLDCACGTGWNALALARWGFEVTASDASAAMLARARENAAAAGAELRLVEARWDELPKKLDARFAAVFCLGNSLVHAGRTDGLVRALAAMSSVLRPGGLLLVAGRDFDSEWQPGRRIEMPDRFEAADDVRCLPIGIWDTPDDFEQPHRLELLFVLERAGHVESRTYTIRYTPYRRTELQLALEEAGLADATIRDEDGWLLAIARRP